MSRPLLVADVAPLPKWVEETVARNKAAEEARAARQLTGVTIGDRDEVCAVIGPWREGEWIQTACGRRAKNGWEIARYDDGITCVECLSQPWGDES